MTERTHPTLKWKLFGFFMCRCLTLSGGVDVKLVLSYLLLHCLLHISAGLALFGLTNPTIICVKNNLKIPTAYNLFYEKFRSKQRACFCCAVEFNRIGILQHFPYYLRWDRSNFCIRRHRRLQILTQHCPRSLNNENGETLLFFCRDTWMQVVCYGNCSPS